jgi:hypothetical protein
MLVPRDGLTVLKKQGAWFLVQLAPELRKLWPYGRYQKEAQGWVHESRWKRRRYRPEASGSRYVSSW